MYLVRTPPLIIRLFFRSLWRVSTTEKVVYLTFDDGPTPGVTPWVLQTLEEHNAKATFFVLGKNVEAHPDLYLDILNKGHAVGNHTYHHLKGWKTGNKTYFEDISRCSAVVQTPYFRPPYGKMKYSQYIKLRKKYTIVLWEVLSGDFKQKQTAEQCLKQSIVHSKPGSIIVFHDSDKVYEKLKVALPGYLREMAAKGYRFEALTGNQ